MGGRQGQRRGQEQSHRRPPEAAGAQGLCAEQRLGQGEPLDSLSQLRADPRGGQSLVATWESRWERM